MNHFSRKVTKLLLSLLMCVGVLYTTSLGAGEVRAAAGDEPSRNKEVRDNNDGTYTIELSVTGDADTTTTTNVTKSNVVIVIDTSGSMNFDAVGSSGTRLAATKTAANTLVDALLANNKNETTADGVNLRDIIEITVVSFAGVTGGDNGNITVPVRQSTDGTTIKNAINALSAVGGTNWERALYTAKSEADRYSSQTGEKTSVIFLTDGMPTFYGANDSGDGGEKDWWGNYLVNNINTCWTRASDDARGIVTAGYTLYNIFAFGSNDNVQGGRTPSDYLKALTNYAYTGTGNYTNTATTDNTRKYFFNASNTTALQEAFETIASSINDTAGIAEVGIADGTTNRVEQTSGEVTELLEVDTTTYKYWMAWNVNNDGTFDMTVDNVKNTYKATQSGSNVTITWTENGESLTATYPGEIKGTKLKIQWDKATDFYNVAPPAATFTNGSVNWNLEPAGVLLDGVTYSYSFEVYPSQYTLDTIADLRNGKIKYSDLDANVQKYLLANDEDGNPPYTLKTNTGATLSYTDTRTGDSGKLSYNDPSPKPVEAKEMELIKEWHGSYWNSEKGWLEEERDMTMTLLRDGKEYDTIELKYSEGFKASRFIAVGILTVDNDGTLHIKTSGHDYKLQETGELTYHWELVADVLHPMQINGTNTMLKLVEDDSEFADKAENTSWTQDGTTYYKFKNGDGKVQVYTPSESSAGLTATNVRRSNLNLTKVVNGADAPADAEFSFTMKLTVPANAPAGEELWFSVWDPSANDGQGATVFPVPGISGATPEEGNTGFYHAGSGSTITVNLKKGQNLRFTNVLTGTTYEFEETSMPTGFEFVKVECNLDEEGTEKDPVIAGQKISGTVVQGNESYVTTFTNKFEFATATPEVTKELSVPQGVIGPEDITGWYTFTLVEANGGKMKIAADEATVVELNKLTPTDGKVKYDDVEYTKISDSLYYYEATELTVTNPDADGGTAAFGKLLFNKADTYEYTVTEAKSADKAADAAKITDDEAAETGKTVTVTVTAAEDGSLTAEVENVTFTNKYEPETIDVTVEKIWKDDSNRDNIRPSSVSVVLTGDNEFSDTQTLNADNEWTYTWSDLLKYANYDNEIAGTAIEYSLEEVKTNVITGKDGTGTYAYKVTGNQTDGFKVENTHTPEKTTVTVTKVWDDADNQDGIRPATVQIRLMAEGEAVGEPVTLPIDGKLTYTWTDLNKNKDGIAIEYTVEEVKTNVITGTDGVGTYAIAVSGTQAEGYTVKNTHTPELTERTVKKEWSDANNQDGIRPESVTMLLKNGDTTVKTVKLPTEDGKWEATVGDLPKYANGTEITYTWSENAVTGYTPSYEVDATDGTITTVTNTHEPAKTTVTVTKVWDDADNQDAIRPETVKIKLLADGKEVEGKTIDLPINGSLTYTWEDLPMYAGSTTAIAYTVEEVTTSVITGTDGPGTYKFEITGTQAAGYKVINTHTPEVTTIKVTKNWDDNSDQDGKRPESVTYKLYADGVAVTGEKATITVGKPNGEATNTWKQEVAGLPKYNKSTTPIVYTIKELDANGNELAAGDKLDANYTLKEYGTDGLSATNTHTPEKTGKIVTKVWVDAENKEGFRPTTLTVDLLADGTKVDSVTLSADNNWTDKIENLDVYKNGTAIKYTWQEQLPEATNPEGAYSFVSSVDSKDETTGYVKTTITNKHTPNQTSVPVTKVWEDAEDQDGIRPETIQIQLMNGETPVGDPVTLPYEGEWKYTWTGLEKYAGGELITYTVKEFEVEGYEVDIQNTAETGFSYTITNTHTPETTEVPVTKEWADDNNRDNKRASSVTAVLKADGKEIKEQTLNEENQWTYTWTGLDKYRDHGTEIVYTVDEKEVPTGYTKAVSGNTITNSYDPERTTVPVEKVWDDADNQDGIRPESITVALKADGTQVMTAELNEGNGWKYTFESTEETVLYKYRDKGTPIEYTVEETKVPEGYTMSQEGNVITNKHVPEVTTVTVKKAWEDNNNNDGKRPEEITVSLKSDGTAIRQLTLNDKNQWTETVDGLPKFKAGQEIKYTFEEMKVDGYEAEYSDLTDGVITITNTHKDELITVKVEKVWKGDEGYDVRPENLKVVLYADGKEVKNATLTEEVEWKTEFTEMPKYNAGKEIVYSANEEKVPTGYKRDKVEEVEKYSFRITNVYKPIKFDPPVKKTLDGDTAKANTSDTFTFKFEAVTEGAPMPKGGESGEMTVTLKAGEENEFGWMYLTKPGTYEYKITEVNEGKKGYIYSEEEYNLVFTIGTEGTADSEQLTCKLTVNGEEVDHEAQDAYTFEFTNTYRELVEIELEKVWVDNDNAEQKRPEKIEVTLYANGKELDTFELNEKNGWKMLVGDLMYSDENFKEIKYTVKENKVPEGYKATVKQDGYKFIVTNSIKSPETGDNSNLTLWLTLLGVSGAGVAGAAYVTAKKRKEEEE